MKKILYVILEQWADWELAYISSAVNMLGGGKFENKTVSLTKNALLLSEALNACPTTMIQSRSIGIRRFNSYRRYVLAQ